VLLLFSVEDVDKEKAFAASDDLRQAMENAGINDKPDVYFLNSGFKPGDAKFFSRSHRAAFSKKTGSTPGASKTSGDLADLLAVCCGSLNALD